MDLSKRSEAWVQEGLITPQQRLRILQQEQPDPSKENIGATILYALGGAVLGAAAVALVLLLDVRPLPRATLFFALGLGMLVSGVALSYRPNQALTDGILMGAIAPMIGTLSGPDAWRDLTFFLPAAVGLGLSLGRYRRYYPGLAGLITFMIFMPIGLEINLGNHAGAWTFLFIAGAVFAASALPLKPMIPWHTEAQMVGTFALTIAFLIVTFEVLNWQFHGAGELVAAAAAALALAIGLWLNRFGFLLAASIVGAIDAIVFAFDFGGLVLGVLTLVGVAIALLFGAQQMRKAA